MATPPEVLDWDVSNLPMLAVNATSIADGIVKAADTMHTTIHDGLIWDGEAKAAAEDKANQEQAQMRAIATAYDDLAGAANGAYEAMEHPLAEIQVLFRTYVHPPVSVGDDWSVHGVEDSDSEAGIQLARIPVLANTLLNADAQWGQRLLDAIAELERMASDEALASVVDAVRQIKADDPNALPDEIGTEPASHWKPDGPAMTAAAVSGAMTDGVKMGLKGAAETANDTAVLKWVKDWGKYAPGISRLGVIGNAIGTVPAISNDIDGGMDPTKVVVSESAGTAVGMAAGSGAGWATAVLAGGGAGATAGSVVPGAGTALGFVVGIGVSAGAAYGTSKGIQALW